MTEVFEPATFDPYALPDLARGPLSEGSVEQQLADLEAGAAARAVWTPEERAAAILDWNAVGVDAEALWAAQDREAAVLRRQLVTETAAGLAWAVDELELAYSPSEPRDYHGRWTTGGGEFAPGVEFSNEKVTINEGGGTATFPVPHPTMAQADYPDMVKRHGETITKAVHDFEDAHRADDHENLLIVAKDGTTLLAKTGGMHKVAMDQREFGGVCISAVAHGGIAVITHNHPVNRAGEDSGLSAPDVGMALYFEVGEMRTVSLFANRSLVPHGAQAGKQYDVTDAMTAHINSTRDKTRDAFLANRNASTADALARMNNTVMDDALRGVLQSGGLDATLERTQLQAVYGADGSRRLMAAATPP